MTFIVNHSPEYSNAGIGFICIATHLTPLFKIVVKFTSKEVLFIVVGVHLITKRQAHMVVLYVPVPCWCTRLKMNRTLISSL